MGGRMTRARKGESYWESESDRLNWPDAPCYRISKGVDGETVVTTTHAPLDTPVQELLDTLRFVADEDLVGCQEYDALADAIRELAARPPTQPTEPVALLQAIADAAHGLCFGEDWNNGTHAKIYRAKLIAAVKAYRAHPQPTEPDVEAKLLAAIALIPENLEGYLEPFSDAIADVLLALRAHPPVQPTEPPRELIPAGWKDGDPVYYSLPVQPTEPK